MDGNASNACSKWSRRSKCSKSVNEDNKINEKNALDSLYVNHGNYIKAIPFSQSLRTEPALLEADEAIPPLPQPPNK